MRKEWNIIAKLQHSALNTNTNVFKFDIGHKPFSYYMYMAMSVFHNMYINLFENEYMVYIEFDVYFESNVDNTQPLTIIAVEICCSINFSV